MAITQTGTGGIKDDAVTAGKIPANAVGSSELADNAVDTAAIADDAVTAAKMAASSVTNDSIDNDSIHGDKLSTGTISLAKFVHGTSSQAGKFLRANNGADPTFETVTGTTINSNADNRLITGSGTANTLNGESNLTYDGSVFSVTGKFNPFVSIDNATTSVFTNNGTSGGNVLKLTSGGTGSGTKIFQVFKNNQSSETEVFQIDGGGKVGINIGGTDNTSPVRNLDIADSSGAILRLISSDDTLGSNERLGEIEFFTDDDDGGHIGSFIKAIADPSDSFGRRTALLFGSQSTEAQDAVERARLDANGNFMVGTTSASSGTGAKGISLNADGAMISRRDGVMHYYKSISTGGYYALQFLSANTSVGSIFFNSGGTQFNTSSDYRRKENIVSLTDGLSKLKQLKTYNFNFKDNPSETVQGFLAHEAQEIIPHAVTGTKDQVATAEDVSMGNAQNIGDAMYQQMDLSKLVPLLTAALQEAVTKIETLETKVAALEAK